jgi:hypothetical protein
LIRESVIRISKHNTIDSKCDACIAERLKIKIETKHFKDGKLLIGKLEYVVSKYGDQVNGGDTPLAN